MRCQQFAWYARNIGSFDWCSYKWFGRLLSIRIQVRFYFLQQVVHYLNDVRTVYYVFSFLNGCFSLYCIFPARSFSNGYRNAGTQAAFQIAGLATALGMAIVGGIIVGLILRLPIWTQLRGDSLYNDEDFWEVPPVVSRYFQG